MDVVLVCRLNALDSITCFAFALILEALRINSLMACYVGIYI